MRLVVNPRVTIACTLELRERQTLSLKEPEVASSTRTFIKRMRQGPAAIPRQKAGIKTQGYSIRTLFLV